MRIAFLLHQFPRLSETFILRQITGLMDLGHSVTVFAEYPDYEGLKHEEILRYKLLENTRFVNAPEETGLQEMPVWPVMDRTWSQVSGKPTLNAMRILRAVPKLAKCIYSNPSLTRELLSEHRYGHQARSLSGIYRLAALASEPKGRFDVLHAHFGPVGQAFRFAKKLWAAPLVVSFHGYDFSTWPQSRPPDAYRNLFDEVDVVTAHTRFAEQRILSLGCPMEKIRRLACGINVNEFAPSERQMIPGRPTRLLSVCRLVEKKGIEFAIRAVADVVKHGFSLEYDIFGSGPCLARLQQLVDEVHLQGIVHFRGAASGQQVKQAMARADIFLLPSVTASNGDTEGAPVSLMEAQACGLPIVSSLHAGIPEIVTHNQSGYLLPERDIDAISHALRQLLQDPDRRVDLGKKGRAIVQKYHDIEKLNRQLEGLYNDVMQSVLIGRRGV